MKASEAATPYEHAVGDWMQRLTTHWLDVGDVGSLDEVAIHRLVSAHLAEARVPVVCRFGTGSATCRVSGAWRQRIRTDYASHGGYQQVRLTPDGEHIKQVLAGTVPNPWGTLGDPAILWRLVLSNGERDYDGCPKDASITVEALVDARPQAEPDPIISGHEAFRMYTEATGSKVSKSNVVDRCRRLGGRKEIHRSDVQRLIDRVIERRGKASPKPTTKKKTASKYVECPEGCGRSIEPVKLRPLPRRIDPAQRMVCPLCYGDLCTQD